MAATPTWFYVDGQPLPIEQAIPGGRSVGVPGNIRMMALAHRSAWQAAVEGAVRAGDPARARWLHPIAPRLRGCLPNDARNRRAQRGGAAFYGPMAAAKPAGRASATRRSPDSSTQIAERGPGQLLRRPQRAGDRRRGQHAPRNPAPMTAATLPPRRQGARTGMRHLSRLSHLRDGPAVVGRDDGVRDPQAARTVRPARARARTSRPPGT